MDISKIIDCSKYDCTLKKVTARSKNLQLHKSCKSSLTRLEYDVVQLSETPFARKNIGKVYKKFKDPITNKIIKRPQDVNIEIKKHFDQTIYTFKDKEKEIGCVILEDHINIPDLEKIYLMTSDIPKFGIVGDRVIVKHLINYNQEAYSGIGSLADKIAVAHCNKLGIKPVIFSEAAYNSHAAHYKRGKRFIYSDENNNPNIIVKQIIENTPCDEKCNTSSMGILYAYMPDEIVEKIQKELLLEPLNINW